MLLYTNDNMATFRPFDTWITEPRKYPGKYKDDIGNTLNGLYITPQKDNCIMRVINNGHVLVRYKYPRWKGELPCVSPMVRWRNLFFCGGYHLIGPEGVELSSNDLLLDAVIDGKKPVGFIFNPSPVMIQKARDSGLPYQVTTARYSSQHLELGICQSGRVGDLFDLEKVVATYELFSDNVKEMLLDGREKGALLNLRRASFSDFPHRLGIRSPD